MPILYSSSRSRAWQTKKKQKLVTRGHAAVDLHQTLHEDRGYLYHFCTLLIFSIGPVVSELGDSKNFGGMPCRVFLLINSSFTNRIAPNVNNFCRPITHINSTDFTNIGQGVSPCYAKKLAILVFFSGFLGQKPPNICLLTWNLARRNAKSHPNPWILSPVQGDKPQNHLLSNFNTSSYSL